MAVAINSQMASAVGMSGSAVTSLTYSFTNTAGTYLQVGAMLSTPGVTISSVTYATVSMGAAIKSQRSHDGVTGALAAIYGLLSPATGAGDVVVTASTSVGIISGALSVTGQHATTPVAQSVSDKGASGTTSTVTVPGTTIGNLIFDVSCTGAGMGTSSQALSWTKNGGFGDYGSSAAGSTAAGTGAGVTMSYTGNGDDGWAIVAVEIAAAVVADIIGKAKGCVSAQQRMG